MDNNDFWQGKYPTNIARQIDTQVYPTIIDLFKDACIKYANKPAFSSLGHTLTFAEIDKYSASFAAWLQINTDLKVGDRIAIQLPNMLQYPIAVFRFIGILLLRRVDVIHANIAAKGSPIRKFPFVLLGRIFGVPVIIQLHSPKLHENLTVGNQAKLWNFITSRLIDLSQGFLVFTEDQREFLKTSFRINPSRIHILQNHVEFTPNELITEIKDRTYDLVFVGRLSKEKGFLDFLEALKLIQTISLDVALVGPNLSGLNLKSKSHAISHHQISFLGEVPRQEVMKVLLTSKILVLPSHSENFPMAILEAFSCGTPAIATDVGAVSQLVQPLRTGSLVRVGDPEGLAREIDSLLQRPGELSEMSANAKHLVSKEFSITHYSGRLIDFYRRVLIQEQKL